VWFSLGENHENGFRSPGFPAVRHSPRAIMCGFLHGKPHEVRWSTKLHRKSGFGLHQLRNRYSVRSREFVQQLRCHPLLRLAQRPAKRSKGSAAIFHDLRVSVVPPNRSINQWWFTAPQLDAANLALIDPFPKRLLVYSQEHSSIRNSKQHRFHLL